ncbi:MAG: gluconate 2-dehydrogenase subunit 3 family protein [Lacunisphaera sp.]
MNRRDAIKRLTLLMGGAVIGAETFLKGEALTGKQAKLDLTAQELSLLDEIGETIIPATHTPGAKAVQIGAFMKMMVNDCYDDAHQAIFQAGLGKVDAAAQHRFGKTFLQLAPGDRTALLNGIDAEEKKYRTEKPASAPDHYFRLMKQMTMLGYFSSEIGCTQALRYVEVPGAFRGSEPYKKGDRAWYAPPSHFI